ncbi:hypothetical protein [Pinibacter soli]|uniref:Uncharacterized protein n=1 Tax=Pinibacter soli TaxID=3044211 RepID=A0ABT6RHE6_9BACT|nr:hypothetical protein [Pinibacter soli]MDI3321269.1 hypothetical protein [Pinibacter soli]
MANTIKVAYKGKPVSVEKVGNPGENLYKAVFENRPPLFIRRIQTFMGTVWNSVPEGNQALAGEIGKLIEKHFR